MRTIDLTPVIVDVSKIGGAGSDEIAYDPVYLQNTNQRYLFGLQGDDYLYSLGPAAVNFGGGVGNVTAVGGSGSDVYQWDNSGSFEVLDTGGLNDAYYESVNANFASNLTGIYLVENKHLLFTMASGESLTFLNFTLPEYKIENFYLLPPGGVEYIHYSYNEFFQIMQSSYFWEGNVSLEDIGLSYEQAQAFDADLNNFIANSRALETGGVWIPDRTAEIPIFEVIRDLTVARASTTFFPETGDDIVDGLLSGSYWELGLDRVITWSLGNSRYEWNEDGYTKVQAAFDAWEEVLDINFVYAGVSTDFRLPSADIVLVLSDNVYFGDSNVAAQAVFPHRGFADNFAGTLGESSYSYPHPEGDIVINLDNPAFSYSNFGSNAFQIVLHEIGHSIGLKHPHDGGLAGYTTYSDAGFPELDNGYLTLMSYDPTSQYWNYGWTATPLPFDIYAAQEIYGANQSANSGNDTYYLLDDGVLRAIWDTAGVDTLDATGVNHGVSIDLEAISVIGELSLTLVAINTYIENAVGSSWDDDIVGGEGINTLNGLGGDDQIHGLGGSDFIIGGLGTDLLFGDSGDDELQGGEGNDYLDGGNGIDVAVVNYLPSQYSFLGGVLSGPEGIDTLENIEYAGFGYNIGDVFTVNVDLTDLVDPDGAGKQSSAASNLLDTISDLYIAYFGRAPDPVGLTFWFKAIYTGNTSFDQAAQSFSEQPEYVRNYPDGSTNRDFIEDIYANMFSRTPDDGGWDFWEAALNDGLPRDIFILAVINGAYAPTGGALDSALLNNKHDVSMYYAEQSMLHPGEEFDGSIVNLLSEVTSDASTVSIAVDVIDFVFEDAITLTGAVNDPAIWDAYWA